MKSKETSTKQTKLTKTAKVALPFFALIGNNGFASSRNPLSLQSSRKIAGKSVVFIAEPKTSELPKLVSQETQNTKTPFAAFTNRSISKIKKADNVIRSEAMKFLIENNLLSANKTQTSQISGNITDSFRKGFSHTWQLPTAIGFQTEKCENTEDGYSHFVFGILTAFPTYTTTLFCSLNQSTVTGTANYTNANYTVPDPAAVLKCQGMHQRCKGHKNLPVELLKFEVD